MFCQGGDTICNLFHIANICLVQTMKFTCTLRDEQSDQYSNWNKLHVAGHWTFQINCRKQNWNFFSFFFFLTAQEGWQEEGQQLTDKTKLWTPKHCRCQAYPWPATVVFCPLSRGTAHNHQYAIPHEGLLVLLGQPSPGPLQCSTLCCAWDTNSVTCKTVPLAKETSPCQSWQFPPRPYFVMKSICPWGCPD